MGKKISKMFLVLETMTFEGVAVTYLYYEVNSCERQSTCYLTVLRSQISLTEIFSNWILLWISVKWGSKCRHPGFVSNWEWWIRWFTKAVLKRELCCIQIKTFFRVNNFQNIWTTNVGFFLKMQKVLFRFQKSKKKIKKMFLVWDIVTFEGVAVTYLYYDENSCDRLSKCYQKVLRSYIWQREMFSNWILFLINVKLG